LAWARRTSIGAIALAMGLSACGGGPPPAAEPADAPVLTQRPAGGVFPVGGQPEGLAFDPASGLLFAGLRDPARLAAIDPRSGRVLRVMPLPAAPRHLALAPGGDLLVPAEDANALIRLSPRGGHEASVRVGEHPHDASFAAGRVFVSDEFGDSVSVVRGGRVIDTLDAPGQPGGVTAVGDRYVAVVAVGGRVLRVLDARTLAPLGEADAGNGPTHAISLGETLLVADTGGNALLRYRLAPRPELVRRTTLDGVPYGLAFDQRRELVWVTLTALNRVEVLRVRGDRLEPVADYPTVRQPNSVTVDPRSGDGFVAGRSAGAIERIPLDARSGR
jgi:DNA-binding beta-propeller fold protein YncE